MLDVLDVFKNNFMKKIFTIFFFLSVYTSNAQESFFRGNNNYVAPPVPIEIVKTGLVLNLDAGDPLSYSGSGNTWTDLSGKGNNGNILSPKSYNSANGGYLQLSVGNGISLPAASNDFNFTNGDYTVEFWVNPSQSNVELLSLNTYNSYWSAFRFDINTSSTMQILSCENPGTWSIVESSISGPVLNTWNHLVISKISGITYAYVNSILKQTISIASTLMSNNPGSTNNTIGAAIPTANSYAFVGKMSIVRIYKGTGLTSSQVTQNYNATKSRFGL